MTIRNRFNLADLQIMQRMFTRTPLYELPEDTVKVQERKANDDGYYRPAALYAGHYRDWYRRVQDGIFKTVQSESGDCYGLTTAGSMLFSEYASERAKAISVRLDKPREVNINCELLLVMPTRVSDEEVQNALDKVCGVSGSVVWEEIPDPDTKHYILRLYITYLGPWIEAHALISEVTYAMATHCHVPTSADEYPQFRTEEAE